VVPLHEVKTTKLLDPASAAILFIVSETSSSELPILGIPSAYVCPIFFDNRRRSQESNAKNLRIVGVGIAMRPIPPPTPITVAWGVPPRR
jgi:hypothetical protein